MAIGSRKMIKTLGVYSIANVLNAGIPFLLLPFLTHYLTPEDYGLIAMFQVILSLSLPLTGLNVNGAISRQYFTEKKTEESFALYVSSSFLIVVFATAVMTLIFNLFANQIEHWSEFPQDWMWVVLVCAFSFNITEILLAIWQVQYKSIQYSLLKISKTIVEMGFSIGLILYLQQNWESRIYAQLIAGLLFLCVSIVLLKRIKMLVFKIKKEMIADILKFGIPLIPHVIGAVIIAMSDRLFITNMIGIAETGLYAVGFQVAQIISLIQTSFNQAWVPYFYGKLNEKKEETNLKIVKFTYMYFAGMIVLALLLTIAAPTIFNWFIGEKYANAIGYVFWISLGFAFNGMYKMVVNYFFYMKTTYWVSIATFFTAGINIILNYYLISAYGPIGAAKATALSFLLQFLIVWLLASKKYKMPWNYFIPSKTH